MVRIPDFIVSDAWREMLPDAAVGTLVMAGVTNPPHHPVLDRRVREVEAELRVRFAGWSRPDLLALPELRAYAAHYRRYRKTYHVQLQLESVALRGKPLGSAGALVTAMFAAEVRTLLLTAGHDLDAITTPITIDACGGGEQYVGLDGRERVAKRGDMSMRDAQGVICTVLYGPDHRTRLTGQTRRALFVVYAPAGIAPEAIRAHLEQVASYVRLVAPASTVDGIEVHGPLGRG